MNNDHPISDEVLELVNIALSKGEHWMAYNQSLYFIDKEDIHFFKLQNEAKEFANDNFSDRDTYHVIYFNSIIDIFKEIPYSENTGINMVNNPDINGLYNHEGNDFTDSLIEHIEQQQSSLFNSQLKTNVMNNENFQYLSDNLKYMGFGENLKTDLERNLNEGKADFQLHYKAEINKKPFEVTMNFRKSDSSDMYFFNNYHASLEKGKDEKAEQTFYLNKGKGVTGKEAFNLLDGRSVHKDLVTKEGQPYKAWMQLDFDKQDKNNNFEVKQFHEKYGFDLKAAVDKFPLTELKDPENEKALLQSLQKGNMQSVNIEKDGTTHKLFIEADPQFKKITLYDSGMKLLTKESVEKYQAAVQINTQKAMKGDVAVDKKKELKQDIKPEKEKGQKKNDTSLLPKKRESSKKGLRIS